MGEKSSECGAVNTSVVGDTRGYDATIEGLKGERRRIGRLRREERKRVLAASWRL